MDKNRIFFYSSLLLRRPELTLKVWKIIILWKMIQFQFFTSLLQNITFDSFTNDWRWYFGDIYFIFTASTPLESHFHDIRREWKARISARTSSEKKSQPTQPTIGQRMKMSSDRSGENCEKKMLLKLCEWWEKNWEAQRVVNKRDNMSRSVMLWWRRTMDYNDLLRLRI